MKKYFLFLSIFISATLFAQDKTISFCVSGSGKTIEQANEAALKSAIIQTYILFVSSDTLLFKDSSIVKEVLMPANNYFINVEKLSYLTIAKGGGFFCVLKPQISIDKLISLAQRKNVSIEQKGGLFSFNIIQQTLSEQNETIIISSLNEIVNTFFQNIFDYSISIGSPKADQSDHKKWNIGLDISLKVNKTGIDLTSFIYSLLKDISLPMSEFRTYADVGKTVYPVSFHVDDDHFSYMLLRSEKSNNILDNLVRSMITSSLKFNINCGFDEFGLDEENQGEYARQVAPFIIGGRDIFGKVPYTYPITSNGDISTAKYVNTRAEAFFEKNQYYNERFPFIEKHVGEFLGSRKTVEYWKDPSRVSIEIFQADPGVVISFSKFKADSVFLKLNYNDVRTLEEMNKIQNYTIITPDVVLANLYAREELIKGTWQNVADTSEILWFKDNQVSPIEFKNDSWTIKKDDTEGDEVDEYSLSESCQEFVVFEVESEEEDKDAPVVVQKKTIPIYLIFKKRESCWNIVTLSNTGLVIRQEGGDAIKQYKRVNYSPAKKTNSTTSKK